MSQKLRSYLLIVLLFWSQSSLFSFSESYQYNDLETRVKKTSDRKVTYYISDHYEEVWSDEGLEEEKLYFFADGQKISSADKEGLSFHYSDHLGSASRVGSLEGALVKSFWYTPFGSDADILGDSKLNYKYTGQEQDDTGLYYYGARYYDTSFARFLAADSLLPDMYDSQALNRYAYVINNPVRLVDPSGHTPIWGFDEGHPVHDTVSFFLEIFVKTFIFVLKPEKRDEMVNSGIKAIGSGFYYGLGSVINLLDVGHYLDVRHEERKIKSLDNLIAIEAKKKEYIDNVINEQTAKIDEVVKMYPAVLNSDWREVLGGHEYYYGSENLKAFETGLSSVNSVIEEHKNEIENSEAKIANWKSTWWFNDNEEIEKDIKEELSDNE